MCYSATLNTCVEFETITTHSDGRKNSKVTRRQFIVLNTYTNEILDQAHETFDEKGKLVAYPDKLPFLAETAQIEKNIQCAP